MNPRSEILAEADKLVNGDRNVDYGDPNIDFKRTAGMWGAYLGIAVRPWQVGWMMAMLKASREMHQHKRDNYADAAGYIACAYHCALPDAPADAPADAPTGPRVGDLLRTREDYEAVPAGAVIGLVEGGSSWRGIRHDDGRFQSMSHPSFYYSATDLSEGDYGEVCRILSLPDAQAA